MILRHFLWELEKNGSHDCPMSICIFKSLGVIVVSGKDFLFQLSQNLPHKSHRKVTH